MMRLLRSGRLEELIEVGRLDFNPILSIGLKLQILTFGF